MYGSIRMIVTGGSVSAASYLPYYTPKPFKKTIQYIIFFSNYRPIGTLFIAIYREVDYNEVWFIGSD